MLIRDEYGCMFSSKNRIRVRCWLCSSNFAVSIGDVFLGVSGSKVWHTVVQEFRI